MTRRQMMVGGLWASFCCPSWPIPAHQLRLREVLEMTDWAAICQVTEIRPIADNYGSGLTITVRPQSSLFGAGLPRGAADQDLQLYYWEGWPQEFQGMLEAPIWSGSGQERQLRVGDIFIALVAGRELLRAEPISQRDQIVSDLKQPK